MGRDLRGSVTLLFALSAAALFGAVGAGIDFARTYTAKQKLSEVATLACQYASRPSVVQAAAPTSPGSNGGATYQSDVGAYITAALRNQQFSYTQTNGTPFTYTQNGPADVSLSANVPTTIMRMFRVDQLSVNASAHCYDKPSTIAQSVPDGPTQNIIEESFEASRCGSGSCAYYYAPNGQGFSSPPSAKTNAFGSTPAYTGAGGRKWYVIGSCLEVDNVGTIESTVPDGTHSVELDCNSNSSMSTQAYIPAGTYELRYFYKARVSYPDYAPAYVCGSTSSDVQWANNTRSLGPVPVALRTNQINVYLDLDQNGAPPTHRTLDNLQTLAGQNLIDVCVYSDEWIERSVRINVNTPGFYWLSFAADGLSESYGGQIDNIRVCRLTCTGSPRDNFPTAWLPSGGVNKELFRDSFEAPVYVSNSTCDSRCTTAGNLNLSLGSTGTAQSGWPNQTASGWVTSPYNQMDVYLAGGASGNQFIELDASAVRSVPTSNRTVSRPFLLDPGYYQVRYSYRSNAWFASGVQDPQCTAAPSRSTDLIPYAAGGSGVATNLGQPWGTATYNTDTVASFMASDQTTSVPVGGGAADSATSWRNPDGSVTSNPSVSPIAVNPAVYNPAQANPVLDVCRYASTWQTRTVAVLIQKPGQYWLHVAAFGTSDNIGGSIDDVRVTALGSPQMANPPPSADKIPVADPQPGSAVDFSAFSIIASPLIPPAATP